MAVKFNKGDVVWEIGSWDQKHTFYYRKLTVMSWGAKKATAAFGEGTDMIKSQIYPEWVNDESRPYAESYFLATPGFDPEAKALELAQRFIDYSLRKNREMVGNPSRHQPSILEKIRYFEAAKPAARAR